ncbi:hypothetical protein J4409_02360 [Candidatus Woesearchaeota archaeon]|nr:hypothetical protein [Candidatus Woesearchaeota archaeon]
MIYENCEQIAERLSNNKRLIKQVREYIIWALIYSKGTQDYEIAIENIELLHLNDNALISKIYGLEKRLDMPVKKPSKTLPKL